MRISVVFTFDTAFDTVLQWLMVMPCDGWKMQNMEFIKAPLVNCCCYFFLIIKEKWQYNLKKIDYLKNRQIGIFNGYGFWFAC